MALPERQRAAMMRQLLHSVEEVEPRSDKLHSGNYIARDWREAFAEVRKQLRRKA